MTEPAVANAVIAAIAMLGWSWLFLYLFLHRVSADIDAVHNSLVARLDARERRLGRGTQRMEGRLESRMQRLEDGQNNLRVELARFEGILIGRGRLATGGGQVGHRNL